VLIMNGYHLQCDLYSVNHAQSSHEGVRHEIYYRIYWLNLLSTPRRVVCDRIGRVSLSTTRRPNIPVTLTDHSCNQVDALIISRYLMVRHYCGTDQWSMSLCALKLNI
jgi:hypothetical protein